MITSIQYLIPYLTAGHALYGMNSRVVVHAEKRLRMVASRATIHVISIPFNLVVVTSIEV
jgi:hypothetical protein